MAGKVRYAMTSVRIPFTGHEIYIPEDQPALYLSNGAGNLPGSAEVHVHLYDPENGADLPLGWISVQRLRDALDAL